MAQGLDGVFEHSFVDDPRSDSAGRSLRWLAIPLGLSHRVGYLLRIHGRLPVRRCSATILPRQRSSRFAFRPEHIRGHARAAESAGQQHTVPWTDSVDCRPRADHDGGGSGNGGGRSTEGRHARIPRRSGLPYAGSGKGRLRGPLGSDPGRLSGALATSRLHPGQDQPRGSQGWAHGVQLPRQPAERQCLGHGGRVQRSRPALVIASPADRGGRQADLVEWQGSIGLYTLRTARRLTSPTRCGSLQPVRTFLAVRASFRYRSPTFRLGLHSDRRPLGLG